MKVSESEPLLPSNVDHALEGIKALIVDDNATNIEILRHYLTAWGIEHSDCDNGHKALEMMQEAANNNKPFELVLLDMDMPKMDGMMLSKTIEEHPTLSPSRRIMLSSSGFITRAKQQEVGISACLSKPYRQSRLLDTTMQVMHEHHFNQNIKQPEAKKSLSFSSTIRMLLVEDNLVNQKMAISMLKKIGLAEPDIACDGKEAVTMAHNKEYDLILMDCQMPSMSGYEATDLIRKREQSHRLPRIPIIAMTANAMQGDREKCLASGMDDYLSKPIKAGVLRDMLSQWLIHDIDQLPETVQSVTEPLETKKENNDPILDLETLNALKDIMEDDFSSLIDSYAEDAPTLLTDLKQSAKEADLTILIRAAHTLKSSSGNLGATLLSGIAFDIEQLGKNKKLQEVIDLIPDLQDALDKTLTELKNNQ